nr:hypothetical protein DO63_5746 [Burkholderia pseudomallei]
MKAPGGRFYFSVDLFANFESPNQPGPRNPPTLSAMRFVTHAVPPESERPLDAAGKRSRDAKRMPRSNRPPAAPGIVLKMQKICK